MKYIITQLLDAHTSAVMSACIVSSSYKFHNSAPSTFRRQSPFLPARRYASAGLCDSDVSVCPSVTRRYCD